MANDTSSLIEATIEQLQTLNELLIDDMTVCRRAGMMSDALKCRDAALAIGALLPRLEEVRSTQDFQQEYPPPACVDCD